jgi:hypothetical protein
MCSELCCCTPQVDATIVAGFTAASTFLTVALQGQSDQRVVLQNALRTVGIDVRDCQASAECAFHPVCVLQFMPLAEVAPCLTAAVTPADALVGKRDRDITEQRSTDRLQLGNRYCPAAILLQLPQRVHLHRAISGEQRPGCIITCAGQHGMSAGYLKC